MPTRNVVLTDKQSSLVDRLVTSGRYQNASEVLRDGLRLVEQREKGYAIRLKALREENRDLRQQLAARTDENARLTEKLNAARTRIEALLKQIPETES